MLSIKPIIRFSMQIGLEMSVSLSPSVIEDVCYSIFVEFSKSATVSVSKPSCIRAIVYGPMFELRFFARPATGEALVTIYSFCENPSSSRQGISKLLEVFRSFSKICRSYVLEMGEVKVFTKVVATLPKEMASRSIKVLSDGFGASLRIAEFRDLDDSSIRVFTGYIPRSGNLASVYARLVIVERSGSYATISVTLEAYAKADSCRDVEEKVYGLVGLSKALMDAVAME
ncbi:MAG: hypothetical protein GXO32_03605 [Crenarchaeota archaeon]|nr:hypothetical protein [Thermoproteota archaeon]